MPPQQPQPTSPQAQSTQPQIQGQLMSTPQPDMTQKANQAKASMGYATNLMTQMLQHRAPQAPQGTQNAPDSTQDIKQDASTEEKGKEPDITKTLTDFKTEIEGMITSKMGDIQRELQTLLSEEKDESNEEKTETTTAA